MIIVLKRHASETDIATISDLVCSLRYQPRIIRGVEQTVIACIGGGSNAIGAFAGFIPDESVALIGVEFLQRGLAA